MNPQTHLTTSQIDDALIGDLAAGLAAHLIACPSCQARVDELAAPFASFRDASLLWAERRSATLATPARLQTTRKPVWITLGAGLTAAIALSLAVPMLHHPHTAATTASSDTSTYAATAPGSPSADEINRDNQMLAAIDQTLDTPIATPVATPGAQPSSQPTGAQRNLLRE